MLFSGDHTRIRYTPKLNQSSALGSFLKKKPSCLNCRQASDTILCRNCAIKDIEIYDKKEQDYFELNKELKDMLN